MSRLTDLQRVLDGGIVAIIRAPSGEQLVDVAGALLEGGIDVIEVTFTVPGVLDIIRDVRKSFGDRILLGAGTAMVYPTLLAAIGDVVHPGWRASAVGVYRLWRDLGYAFGAVIAGVVADMFGVTAAIWVIAAITFVSGAVVKQRMRETMKRTV